MVHRPPTRQQTAITPLRTKLHTSQMATRAEHRPVAAAILLTAMALGAVVAAQAAAGADGRRRISPGPASSRVPLLPVAAAASRVQVQCTKMHVLAEGETCASVARAARITVPELVKLNPDMPCAELPHAHGRSVCVRGYAIG